MPRSRTIDLLHRFPPLPERCFERIVDYEGSSRHLRFDLSPAQVEQLLSAFRAHAGHAGWKR